MKLLTLSLITSLLMASYALAGEQSNGEVAKLKWIETASPENDAKAAIQRKDFRLRAVYGYSIEIPGVDQKDYTKVQDKFGINPIVGTSDSIVNSEHARLTRLAAEYALKYNMVILNLKKE